MKRLKFLLFFIIIAVKFENIFSLEEGIWNPLLEEWTLGNIQHRQSRIMQIPLQDQTFMIQERIDTNSAGKESKINVGKITTPSNNNNNNNNYYKPNKPPPRQISETDLYLLGAIEKMVYKVDFMEKRLRRVEEMLYYVMAGNRVDIEPCADNFTRAGQNCYMFASMAGREYDWKVASKHCKKFGGFLAEMERIEETQDLIAHIQTDPYLKGKDFWLGGLNPGLLWMWSTSARPIIPENSQNNNNSSAIIIHGDGRCLRLAYNPALKSYGFKGTDCSTRYSYICEQPENSSSNEIQRLGKSRKIFDEL